MFLNVYSKGKYPANILSNFAANTFDFDGFCNIPSMESFLQSLKFSDPDMQRNVLYMEAKTAKRVGSTQHWQRTLNWKGTEIDRFSREYTLIIESAYRCLLANTDFRKALKDSNGKILIHTIGKFRRSKTVLTWWEFVSILSKLRREMNMSES